MLYVLSCVFDLDLGVAYLINLYGLLNAVVIEPRHPHQETDYI